MPRANRFFLPGYIWHITHRCHKKEYLLKFINDRRRWIHWLCEAKKRFKLTILNYIVTSNHIHLLVYDKGEDSVIAQSMQLIAGRTAQEYNRRKNRTGAFWEDRYHATAISTDKHLIQCMLYIDLNMIRAGVVRHPGDWPTSGYHEIQKLPGRRSVLDLKELLRLFNFDTLEEYRIHYNLWIDNSLKKGALSYDQKWSQSIAVGNESFIDEVISKLGKKAEFRDKEERDKSFILKEPGSSYSADFKGKKVTLRVKNTYFWNLTR